MRASNEMQVENLRSKISSLPTTCRRGYTKAKREMRFQERKPTGTIWQIFVDGSLDERQLFSECNPENGLDVDEMVSAAHAAGFSNIRVVELNREHSWDQEIADSSELLIDKITDRWAKHPSKATPSSAVKLIAAYYNLASRVTDMPVRVRIHNNAVVDGEVLTNLRDSIGSSTVAPAVKAVRERFQNLCQQFGSPDNLGSYQDALAEVKADPFKAGRKCARLKTALTNTRWSPSRVGKKHVLQLFNLVLRNLGNTGKIIVPRTKTFEVTDEDGKIKLVEEKDVAHIVGLSLPELCELIALKLALQVRHEATKVEELNEMMANFRRIASWLSRRANQPSYGGFMARSEMLLPPHMRERAYQRSQLTVGDTWLGIMWGANKYPMIGCFDEKWRQSEAKTIEKKVLVSSRIPETGSGRDIVEKKVLVEVVESNVVSSPIPERPEKDWDIRFSVMGARMFEDQRFPGSPLKYYGPSFVKFLHGPDGYPIAVKPTRCDMHDGRLWSEWEKAKRPGECPTCYTTHIQKIHIWREYWTPKVDVRNEWVENDGTKFTTGTTCLASPESMRVVMSKHFKDGTKRKHPKPMLEFDPNVRMPLMVPAFRSYVEDCVNSRRFVAPPMLEWTHKMGILLGKKADRLTSLEQDYAMLMEAGHPAALDLAREIAALKAEMRGFARDWRILHIYIPFNPALFDIRYLPAIAEGETRMDWAIQAQIYGDKLSLLKLCEDHHGLISKSVFREEKDKSWTLIETSDVRL